MKKIQAWHFVGDDGKRRDGVIEKVGKTYHIEGDLVMCERGLHASRRILDALQYAPGLIVRRVECWGKADEQSDKIVCRYRKVLWQKDITNILHEFACRVAEDALTTAGITDERCWNAIKTKRAWLRGETTDEELSAARAVAWAAAWAAARAAGAAARAADRTVAWAAAWAADRAAARDKYNAWLEEMVDGDTG